MQGSKSQNILVEIKSHWLLISLLLNYNSSFFLLLLNPLLFLFFPSTIALSLITPCLYQPTATNLKFPFIKSITLLIQSKKLKNPLFIIKSLVFTEGGMLDLAYIFENLTEMKLIIKLLFYPSWM